MLLLVVHVDELGVDYVRASFLPPWGPARQRRRRPERSARLLLAGLPGGLVHGLGELVAGRGQAVQRGVDLGAVVDSIALRVSASASSISLASASLTLERCSLSVFSTL